MTINLTERKPGQVAVIGVPFDANSSYLPGAASAPDRIREWIRAGSGNSFTELGIDLNHGGWIDMGNIPLVNTPGFIPELKAAADQILSAGQRILALGGDHSITLPLVKAYANHLGALTILHLDAHADTYDEFEGSRSSHACPFARIMEAGLARRLLQVGIRTLTDDQRAQIDRFGIEVIEMRSLPAALETSHLPPLIAGLSDPIYLSVDMDVFDPGYAPGVSHHEPGGMNVRSVLAILHGLKAPILGADLVEFNPLRDTSGITAALATKLVKEILGLMLSYPA